MSDIHEKIMNLLDLARNNPSEEEAASAAAMAQRLMMRYNLSEADLGRTSNVDYSGGGAVDRDYWRLLMTGMSHMLPVKAVLFGRGRNIKFKWAGTPVNCQTADLLLQFWADQVEALYKQHLPRGMTKSDRAQYRTDFKRNCAVVITQRAREIKRQQIADEGEKGTALVVIEDQMLAEVSEFLASKGVTKGRSMKIRSHTQGAAHGRQAGQQVQLQRTVR